MAKKRSPYINLLERPEGKNMAGPRPYDPASIYKYTWDNTDDTGRILYTHEELANAVEIERANFTRFLQIFEEMGFIESKFGKQYMIRSPESILWEPDAYDEFAKLRTRFSKKYQDKYRAKKKQEQNNAL